MNQRLFLPLTLLLGIMFTVIITAQAQQHRATRLGNPATRFAKPLQTTNDLRNMLRAESPLRADVDSIIHQCDYQGDLADLRRAAAEAPIAELKIPVGTRLPAMSSRENGKPILLHDVLWAGKEPIDAYEFFFTSKGRRFRLVSPKACSNFWVEDKGKETRPALTLACEVPEQVPLQRPAKICLSIKNIGDAAESLTTVTLPVPTGATFVSATSGGKAAAGLVTWELPNLAAGSNSEVCAAFTLPQPGSMIFAATARGAASPTVASHCETRVIGIPAVLIEVIDLDDPIEVGTNETYVISVLNQGSAVLTNLKFVCTLEDKQQFVSGSGSSPVSAEGGTITLEKLPVLNPKETVSWRVIVKAVAAGDVRFNGELTCDQFKTPIPKAEATQQY